ncbi:pantoate--beta-alanine ligase [Nocardioides rotundus]|uniref:pantoate--beta-alanine ligase n=1 Tax=Nocardioides rotundus TaxID=1774216 RepID=UPI001CBE4AA5|nr:pantoate--beta-alanine ligase [Nocardioides rotundus]UAL29372.1 pantoate--beta-alanine ligase [Nocardioides rotundus]
MSAPVLVRTRAEVAALLEESRREGRRIGLVPTMGALHEGHASLMRVAREHVGDGPVVVSVFVNPLQFGPGEDLDRYPRTMPADLELSAREGVDVVYAPEVADVYPGSGETMVEPQVTVDPGPLGEVLEGRTRPGHFRGVLTVVTKLLGLVRPDVAVFGQKDYQQLTLVRRLVDDLCLGVEIVGAPTLREPDGLALSSRNRYLDPEEREAAVALSRALTAAAERAGTAEDAEAAARAVLHAEPRVVTDYLVVTDPALGPLPEDVGPGTSARILVAATIGTTRLIDNAALTLGPRGSSYSHTGGTPVGARTAD